MSSNHYNSYHYPYQQTPTQEYSAHQTVPAPNQQPPSTQGNDYMSYQTHSYGGQSSGYGDGRDNSWNGSNYVGNREVTNRAAEVLRDMSSNAYTPTTTGATQTGFTARTAAIPQPEHYSTGSSNSSQMQPQQPRAIPSAYSQTQSRPHSANTHHTQQVPSRSLPSPVPRAQTLYDQQGQRSTSPAQHQYSKTPGTTSSSARIPNMIATASNTEYHHQHHPGVSAPRANHNTGSSASYHANMPTVVPPGPIAPPASSAPEPYTSQGSTTVDPMAVYDPWPEYHRQQDARRAQKAAEDSRRIGEERKAEEVRKAADLEREEERKREIKQQQKSAAEMRAMMARMRELNGKDPALLARIWEEERKPKIPPVSPSPQNKSPTPASAPVPTSAPAQTVQINKPPPAKPRQNATSSGTSVAKPATPNTVSAAQNKPQAQAVSVARHGGNTIWPAEKKNTLASAAAVYLNAPQILSMLDGNPSYIELCEQLERLGFRLDRAAFAKNLLTAVPDVNAKTQKAAPQPAPVQRPQVPPAVMKTRINSPSTGSPAPGPAVQPRISSSYQPFPSTPSFVATPAPVAEMVPIKQELKQPANKEEAARKRKLSDLVDLTQLSDDEDMGLPQKKINTNPTPSYTSPYTTYDKDITKDNSEPAVTWSKAPTAPPNSFVTSTSESMPQIDRETWRSTIKAIDKKKALRRNTYNPATIARDVLLACGRHPYERQLNQHLDCLRSTLQLNGHDFDLSTIRWDLLDPGTPPRGYFKDGVQDLAEDADDEVDSDEDKTRRPPLHNKTTPRTPKAVPSVEDMNTSAPRTTGSGVGYAAFQRPTEIGPDGKPLPKKKGRPVGWRKSIHGSDAAQARLHANGHTGKHKSSQRSVVRNEEPLRISSQSPGIPKQMPRNQSYKCKWQNCVAELHNLETLKKHVYKVHRKQKQTLPNTLECWWHDCGKEVTQYDHNTGMRLEKHAPHFFDVESDWIDHIQQTHFDPLSWELGDGPASGLSDAQDSEAYLSDVQGRSVTPRISVDPKRIEMNNLLLQTPLAIPRGRGRLEQEAWNAQERLFSRNKRIGGPGMDRGGATLVNDKRRRGFSDDNGTEEELVDAED
ncbi:hypothetical protein GQ44DRAFT_746485 [Phaeosphaeriaceae sp. PMI808]|nr:hypothetical protein GQ44DRAFT_746485 [Phaeosphaeriaceae sp. PMI808]